MTYYPPLPTEVGSVCNGGIEDMTAWKSAAAIGLDVRADVLVGAPALDRVI